ncbi:3-carboxyethylcatechol 2,3-dioxygenase [Actinomycetospora straminea]|uniref:2,3-dihydroxyphenylpropionate/2,3-dihydroxicinnamic acid 1,2-dioxygenase n=2 Tax=Actinomycetospora straminea TaxID=663607 RepID=A0ABP9EAT4_9PSEU
MEVAAMALALCAMSHSPLLSLNEPRSEVRARVDVAREEARAFVTAYEPDLVVVIGPDHYNGFFYDLMPPFCIGTAATSIGDYDTVAGPLPVEHDTALAMAGAVLDAEVDVAVSERMKVDHGLVQPLEFLFGSFHRCPPVIPVFINGVAVPLGPARRARLLGDAIGGFAAGLDRRVLLLASGGLSHDPPVPQLASATPEVAEGLIDGRNPTPEARAARQERVIVAGQRFAEDPTTLQDLNPEWDQLVLDTLVSGRLADVDRWTNAWFQEQAGNSSHEVRTWIAAYAALAAAGPYEVGTRFYEPIREWIAGFAVTTATPTAGQAHLAMARAHSTTTGA